MKKFALLIHTVGLRTGPALLFWTFLLMSTTPALALVVDVDDGQGEEGALDPPIGWSNVGRRIGGPSSLVYLGNRWVITAAHVGAGIVEIGDQRYDPVAGSPRILLNADGSEADLVLFQLARDPEIPAIRVAERSPRIGQDVTLIGMGAMRGAPITIDSGKKLLDGFMWEANSKRRWGTNRVAGPVGFVQHADGHTAAFPLVFEPIDDPLSSAQEAMAGHGDSGGGVISLVDALRPELGWNLSGIMFSIQNPGKAPARSSLYGGVTLAADLATYHEQINRITGLGCAALGQQELGEGIDFGSVADCAQSQSDPTRHLTQQSALRWLWVPAITLIIVAAALGWRAMRKHQSP